MSRYIDRMVIVTPSPNRVSDRDIDYHVLLCIVFSQTITTNFEFDHSS